MPVVRRFPSFRNTGPRECWYVSGQADKGASLSRTAAARAHADGAAKRWRADKRFDARGERQQRLLARTVAVVAALVLVGVAVWRLGSPGGSRNVQRKSPPATQTRPHRPARHRAAPHRPRRPPPVLALTAARGGCWLSVRLGSGTGRTVYEQTIQQGRTIRFGLRRPLWIRLGAPWNVDGAIGRRPVTAALPTRTGGVIATAAGLRGTP